MNPPRSVALAVAFVAGAGSLARADDDKLAGELVACVRASAATAGIDPWMVPQLFARDCAAPCSGLAGFAATPRGAESAKFLGTGCHLFCSDSARAAFEATTHDRRWPELAERCGARFYGLPAAQSSLFSDVWFVAHTLGDWFARANEIAGPKSRLALAELAKSLPRVRWLLPLPASLAGHYDQLPLAGHGFDSVSAADYLLVDRDSIRMGAHPEAKVTVQGAKLQSDWPGQTVALPSLAKRQEAYRRPVAPIAGRNRGVLGPAPSPADATINLVRASGPLLLIDANAPAARVVEVLEALGDNGARLGVTDGRGDVGEHAVLLSAHPLAIGEPTSHLSLTLHGSRAFNDRQRRGAAVWINVQDASVRELADVMNELYDEGVRLVVVDHAAAAPYTATARGSLDKGVIRSVIRLHLAEVRACYEHGLARRVMEGRVMVRFVVSTDGPVVDASVQESTLGDDGVERCITDAVKSWVFPKPDGGGIVVVSYPFVLKSAEPDGGMRRSSP